MKLIIDIVLLVIIALCTWNGFKKGLIGGIAGILAVLIAIIGGNMLSHGYAGQVIPALEPFVDGYISSADNRVAVMEQLGYGGSDLSLNDILERDPSLRYDYAYECMRSMGFYSGQAEELADDAVMCAEENGVGMTEAVVTVLCDTITYVGGLAVAFLLILILLVAIGNIGSISFRLPSMEAVDEVGGAVLGFAKAFVYCTLLCWFFSFFGLVLGKDTLAHTTLARFFLAFRFLTNGLL